jgi:CXXC-20-CXXC protein
MTIQDNWKRELDQLHLTEIQKERMVDHIKSGIKQKKSYVAIILPAFVVLALFSGWLALQPSTGIQQTGSPIKTTNEAISIEKIIWLTLTLLLMMSAYTLALISLIKVRRWQNSAFALRIIGFLKSYQIIWIIISLLGLGFAMTAIASRLENSLTFLQFFFIVFLFANTSFIQILLTRNEQRALCPHCGVELTNKEMLKKSFMIYDAKCNKCKKKMYYDRKKNQNSYLIQVLWMPICLLMPSVGISFYLMIIYFVLYAVFTFGYLFPYTVRFSTQSEEQQPPLW